MKITRSDLMLHMAHFSDKTEREKHEFARNMYERLDLLFIVISEIESDKDFSEIGEMLRYAIECCGIKGTKE